MSIRESMSNSQAMQRQLLGSFGDVIRSELPARMPAAILAFASTRKHFISPFATSTSTHATLCRDINRKQVPASKNIGSCEESRSSSRHGGGGVITHSMPAEKIEMFKALQGWAKAELLAYLKPVEKSWQPQDFLPDSSRNEEAFVEEIKEVRRRSKELPEEYLVCLVGDMITEEALPTYHTFLNSLDGVLDETGASPCPWACWIRSWTAEENRHGDLLSNYLYLTGRVDMRSIQKTIHYLIAAGMDLKTENNPYLGFIYTSFQERATFIAHGNTARQAKQFGDLKLAHICGTIAADERRHENAYQKIVEKLFEVDPNDTMLCFEDMMKKRISMPAQLMYDGCDHDIYDKFSLVAQRTGVYTAQDYANILEHLVKRWNVEKMVGLSSRGQQAQDYVCNLATRIRKLEERAQSRVSKAPKVAGFSWIFNKEVTLV